MIEKYLSKLGTLLQKRKRASFKNDLRAQLLNRALELNEAPAKKAWAWPDWQSVLLKRVAPATAGVLVVLLAIQFLVPSASMLPQLVDVAEAKDYYVLTPESTDEEGVASESSFALTSKGDLKADEVKEVLKVYPEAEITVEQVSDTEVRVMPVADLEPGTVYSFTLEAQNLDDSPYPKEFSWAYEVSDAFRITGTLPGNQEAGVPINTGIEIYFTYNGVDSEDFERSFSISPSVSGDFEVNGKTGVFMPKEDLAEHTLYTVTLAGSLGIGEGQTLGEDYSFEFETDNNTRSVSDLNFTRKIYEFSPEDVPQLQFYYWSDDSEDLTAQVKVYAYDSNKDYLAAIVDYQNKAPTWAYYQKEFYDFNTQALETVLSVDDYKSTNDNGYWLILPEALDSGYYLVQFSENDAVDYAFVQVSNQAVYLNMNDENSLIWVNSTESGEPIKGASVRVLDTELKGETDKQGIAELPALESSQNFKVGDWYNLMIEVSSEEATTYYSVPYYKEPEYSVDDYWQIINTDRVTYQPTDTVHYWGFVQGRDKPIEDKATAYLVEGYVWDYQSRQQLEDTYAIIDQREINIKDGEAFGSAFDIQKLANGTYTILIVQGDNKLTSKEFYVEDYVKPSYKVSIAADKTALYVGETAHITITAQFFEGTPVPNTDFRVSLPGNDMLEQVLTTDENGQIELDWTASNTDGCGEDYCGLYSNPSVSVTPVQEELGEVQEWLSFKILNSDTVIDSDNANFTNDIFTFQAYDVDLEAVDYDASAFATYFDLDSIFGSGDSKSHATVSITQVDYVKTKDGQYYDPKDKVMKDSYTYNREEKLLKSADLTPNGSGEYKYKPELSDEYDYDIKVRVFDDEGGSYVERFYIYNRGDANNYNSLIMLVIPGSKDIWESGEAKIGDNVTVAVQMNELAPVTGKFLFMQNHKGIQEYEVQDESSYEFTFEEEDVPNTVITAVNFDGDYYRESGAKDVQLNVDDRSIDLEVTGDKESYEPGEEVTLTIKSSEQAQVSLYLVDEAYYALYAESFRDPLGTLYSDVGSGVDYTYISHRLLMSEGDGGKGGCFIAGTQILMTDGSTKAIEDIVAGDKVLTRENAWSSELVTVEVMNTVHHTVGEYLLVNGNLGVTEEHVLFINGQWQLASALRPGDLLLNKDGDPVVVDSIEHIRRKVDVYNFETADKHTYFANGIYAHNDKGESREDFRDTAFFEVIDTDAAGNATVTFELPDNITSWRVSATAVSGGKEIHGGFTSATIPVSKDVFISPIINSTYLAGDQPSLPVRAYGDALSEDSEVLFSMGIEALDYDESIEGMAFETSTFNLPELQTGSFKVSSTAEAEGKKDTVILPVTVLPSHMSQNTVSAVLLSEGTKLEGADEERTEVHFLNNEVGTVYETLIEGYFQSGDRADEALARTLAGQWLNEVFDASYNVPEFANEVYQKVNEDGGIALLPYADSDLELSAKMAALAPEQVSEARLSAYFESVLNSKDRTLSEKLLALYGLAGLDQAYLNELDYFVSNFELSDEDKLYAALAYSEFNEDMKATELFLEIYKDGDAEWTILLATLAEAIGSDQAVGLWKIGNDIADESEDFVLLEKMLYAKARLEAGAQKTVSFKLNGEKVELSGSDVLTRSYLPKDLKNLSITDVDGEVAAVSFYQSAIDLDDIDTSNSVKITRSYFVNGKEVSSLKVGDLVEVHIKASAPKEGSYEITDYLPSGLQTATWASHSYYYQNDDSYRHPYDQSGQVLKFYMSCYEGQCYGDDFYYLARVINPGSFILEPATVQSYKDPEVINLSGERATLTIE